MSSVPQASQTDFDGAMEASLLEAFMRRRRVGVDAATDNMPPLAMTLPATTGQEASWLPHRSKHAPQWQPPTAVIARSTAEKRQPLGHTAHTRQRAPRAVEDVYCVAITDMAAASSSSVAMQSKIREPPSRLPPLIDERREDVSWASPQRNHVSQGGARDTPNPRRLEQKIYLHPSLASGLPLKDILRIEEATRRRARATRRAVVAADCQLEAPSASSPVCFDNTGAMGNRKQ
jgi:hypothetical protein